MVYSDVEATGGMTRSVTTVTVDHRRTTRAEKTLARRVARSLARAIRSEPSVSGLWVWSEPGYIEPGREYVELWVCADPAGPDDERRLRRAGATLHESYPDANIRIHTITPRMLNGRQPSGQVRDGAEEVALEAP